MKTFKQRFCEYYNCPPEHYLREAFFRTLHPRARPIRWLLYWCDPTESLILLHEAGESTTQEDLRDAILQHKYDAQELGGGTLSQRWKFCVSRKRLIALSIQLRKEG